MPYYQNIKESDRLVSSLFYVCELHYDLIDTEEFEFIQTARVRDYYTAAVDVCNECEHEVMYETKSS